MGFSICPFFALDALFLEFLPFLPRFPLNIQCAPWNPSAGGSFRPGSKCLVQGANVQGANVRPPRGEGGRDRCPPPLSLLTGGRCSDSDFRWFQQYLGTGTRHGLYIAGFLEDKNTGKKTARISECTQGKQKAWVGSREPTYARARDFPTQRQCLFDGNLWTLSQTLDFALNERGASYNWTIGFWERDFV